MLRVTTRLALGASECPLGSSHARSRVPPTDAVFPVSSSPIPLGLAAAASANARLVEAVIRARRVRLPVEAARIVGNK